MKSTSNLILAILVTFFSYGAQSSSLRLNNESADAHHASGIALTVSEYDDLYLGISANIIRSNLALESANRNKIYPVYVFMGLSANYPISPFGEFGLDLGDALLDKIFEGDGQDIDVYFSFGLRLAIKKTIELSVYHKVYDLYFNEMNDPTLQNASLHMTGVNLAFYLK